MSEDTETSLSLTTFSSKFGKVKLSFQNNILQWNNAALKYVQKPMPIRDVVFVERLLSRTRSASKKFKLCYIISKSKNRYRHKFVKLAHTDPNVVTDWVTTLNKALESLSHRPKRLLLFINPYGGRKKGMAVYEKIGKPLFTMANVDVTVIVSQTRNQIYNVILDYNLDVYDAVACIGGDGTFSEIVHGLVWKECNKLGINPKDTAVTLPRPKIPVGIIPGGSSDQTAYCLYGTSDPKTAILQIIVGYAVGLDLLSVYNDNSLIGLCADVLSYGYLGDIAHFSESLRWMGPTRYKFTGLKKILQNTGYLGKLDILVDSSDHIQTKCYHNCPTCSAAREEPPGPVELSWKTISGKFFMISAANISCAGKHSPDGISPFSHLGDGFLNLIIVHHTSLFKSLQILNRMTSSNYALDDVPEVTVLRGKEFSFTAQDAESRWNCDGEVIYNSSLRTKINCQLLTVYGQGMKKPL